MTEPIDKVLDALRYVGPRNCNTYQVVCPSHNDNKASLSVSLGNNGGAVLFCHACGKDATPKIVQAIGLTMADLSPNGSGSHASNGAGASGDPVVATYDYVDEHGSLLYQSVRRASKKFTQRQPDGAGGWIWSITKPPVGKVLYRLPALMAADPAQWVYVVEGEKDVDNVIALGAVATCNVGGAGKWDAAYTQTLMGRDVCILPDNDLSGQNHAKKVSGQLQGKAAQVVILNLPGLGSKEDVSDWIARGGTLTELEQLTQQAATSTPTPAPSASAVTSGVKTTSQMLIQTMGSLGIAFRLNRLEDNVEVDGKRLDDITLSDINLKLTDEGFSRPSIADAINVLAGRNAYDPVEDYLLGLKWDGKNHLGDMMGYLTGDGTMVKYTGQDVPLHAVLIVKWMTGAVARGLNRGTSAFNHQTPMLVLIGRPEIGKSSWVRWLTSGIGPEFHRESMVNPHGVEDMRSMVTKWIWEVSELGSSLRRGDRDSLKAFITQEWHTYRKPWGKHQITKPTLCNFVGTLNPETGFLDDPTGHRRFLPVVINAINHDYKDAIDINQLWAQVVSMYQSGQITPGLNQVERDALATVHKQHEVENPLETYINMYFDVVPSNKAMKCHTAVIIQRLQAFGINMPSDPKVAGRKINDVLAPMGLDNGAGKPFRIASVLGRGWMGIQPNTVPLP